MERCYQLICLPCSYNSAVNLCKYLRIAGNRFDIYPQAFAAITNIKSQLNQHLRVFLVDIGGYTTDVLLLRNGKPDLQFCRSLEMGVITMNNDIIRREAGQHHAKDILDKLRELQVDLRSNLAVFIGGGSILYREYLENSPMVASATFIENPKANAVCYYSMANLQMKLSGR